MNLLNKEHPLLTSNKKQKSIGISLREIETNPDQQDGAFSSPVPLRTPDSYSIRGNWKETKMPLLCRGQTRADQWLARMYLKFTAVRLKIWYKMSVECRTGIYASTVPKAMLAMEVLE